MRVASYHERLERISSVSTLHREIQDAQRSVMAVKSWVKSQLPPQFQMVPNSSRFFPHLHRKIQQAVEVERQLRVNFYKLKHELNTRHQASDLGDIS